MTRQRYSHLLLLLALATGAGLQTACAESNGDETEPQAAAEEATAEAPVQVAANEGGGEDAAAANASEGAGDEAAASDADTAKPAAAGGGDAKPYEVVCTDSGCVAGPAVVTGYDIYGKHCHRCHGGDALGSSFAPSLVRRLKDLKKGEFIAVVANGKTSFQSSTGGYRVMPPWKGNKDVMGHLNQLWAYLKARSDGALPAVRPEPMK